MSNSAFSNPDGVPMSPALLRILTPAAAAAPMTASALLELLPPRTRLLLSSPPAPGNGLHQHIFSCVRHLLNCTDNRDLITQLLEEQLAPHCGRDITREIGQALQCCRPQEEYVPSSTVHGVSKEHRTRNQRLIDETPMIDLEELIARSPDDPHLPTREYLPLLYTGDPLLCMATRLWKPVTTRLSEYLSLSEAALDAFQLMVPNPMTEKTGVTQEGKVSARSLSNVGPRRYLIIEFDTGRLEKQAGLLLRLGSILPCCMILWSGNKSLHGWFSTAGVPDETMAKVIQAALVLGADPATLSPILLVRTPNAFRDGGRGPRQEVLYLDRSAVNPD